MSMPLLKEKKEFPVETYKQFPSENIYDVYIMSERYLIVFKTSTHYILLESKKLWAHKVLCSYRVIEAIAEVLKRVRAYLSKI